MAKTNTTDETTTEEVVTEETTPVETTEPTKKDTVTLKIRGGHSGFGISTEQGVYLPVDGIIEVPADVYVRIEGDPDYEVVG